MDVDMDPGMAPWEKDVILGHSAPAHGEKTSPQAEKWRGGKRREVCLSHWKLLQKPLMGQKAFVTLIGAGDRAEQMKVIKGREMDGAQGIRLFCQRQIHFQKKPLSIPRE